MKITLHADRCMACGSCAAIAPTVFSLKDTVNLIKDADALTNEEKTLVKQASSLCPGEAIEITE